MHYTKSNEETENLGSAFAKNLKPGSCLSLVGELGAGKTTFVRGLYEGLGGVHLELVHSPTFSLMHQYPLAQGFLYHLDFYRIDYFREVLDLDFEDQIKDNITVIEWGNKFLEMRDWYTHQIILEVENGGVRKISMG